MYSLVMMYRIGRDRNKVTLICLACPHTERVQDFDGRTGNRRTLAARAMLKHIYEEHSRSSHVRALAIPVGRENTPTVLPRLVDKKGLEENLSLGHRLESQLTCGTCS